MKTCPTCQMAYPDEYSHCPRDGASLMNPTDWTVGAVVRGKYRILGKLGEGGMGAVYEAQRLFFGDFRALKVIKPEYSSEPRVVKRFQREARITFQLQHLNVVQVFDFDTSEDGHPFIVMEYIEGKSLKELIESEAPLLVPRVCCIIKQVAEALGAAHKLGIVHRDIKPDNIRLVSQGLQSGPAALQEMAKVLDFGIATLKEARASGTDTPNPSLSNSREVFCTPKYMSPEQAKGKKGNELDGRSDLYSLGVVMYEMLTGKHPFEAESDMAIAHILKPPKPIREALPGVQIPEAIVNLVMRCLEKDPKQRPDSAATLLAELGRAENKEPLPSIKVSGTRPPPTRPQPHLTLPKPMSRFALILALSVLAVAIGRGVWHRIQPRESINGPTNTTQSSQTKPIEERVAAKPEDKQPIQLPPSPSGTTTRPGAPMGSKISAAELARQINAAKTEGDLFYENGEYDNAINTYQAGLNVNPKNAELLQKIRKARNAKATEGTIK
jgi:serine/threonine protein kinase